MGRCFNHFGPIVYNGKLKSQNQDQNSNLWYRISPRCTFAHTKCQMCLYFFSGFLANRKDFYRALRALLLSGQWKKGNIQSGLKTHKWITSQGNAVVKFCGICSSLSIRPKSSIFWDLTEKDLHVWINDNLEPSICFILYYWMIWFDTIPKTLPGLLLVVIKIICPKFCSKSSQLKWWRWW